jgi:hypothetical protein
MKALKTPGAFAKVFLGVEIGNEARIAGKIENVSCMASTPFGSRQ